MGRELQTPMVTRKSNEPQPQPRQKKLSDNTVNTFDQFSMASQLTPSLILNGNLITLISFYQALLRLPMTSTSRPRPLSPPRLRLSFGTLTPTTTGTLTSPLLLIFYFHLQKLLLILPPGRLPASRFRLGVLVYGSFYRSTSSSTTQVGRTV